MTKTFAPAWRTALALLVSGCAGDFGQTQGERSSQRAERRLSSYAAVDLARVRAALGEPEQWFTTGRDFGETRYSPLSQIDRDNAADVGFAWDYDTLTTRGLEATPVVVDGVMYTSGTWGKVYALNAATGEQLWRFDPRVDGQVARDVCCDVVNRGVAVWRGRVYVAAIDGRLFALDGETGEEIWVVDTIFDHDRRYSSTGAPRIAGDIIVIGNGGAEFDARGYISAYNVETGELAWRFFTVPGDPSEPFEHPELEMAAATWDPDSLWELGGGGTVWDSLVYDPDLNYLYVGTGNAAPYAIVDRSPSGGDNLFLSSILAIDAETGRLAWHYQTTPGDSWDYTATQNMILTDLTIDGEARKVLMQAPKNGFFYVLDRETGELLSADAYVPVNWASHVDMGTGKPVLAEAADYFTEPKVQWPTDAGGHGWRPMAYSPDTGLVYIPAWEWSWLRVNLYPEGYEIEPGGIDMGVLNFPPVREVIDHFAPLLPYDPDDLMEIIEKGDPAPDRAHLRAWNPVTSEVVWNLESEVSEEFGGLLATGGGLVITGTLSGRLNIYADETGELLHSIDTGTSIMAAPATYEVDGEQYIAVMAGAGGAGVWSLPKHAAAYERGNDGRIIAFKLGGGDTPMPPVREIPPIPEPPGQTATPELLAAGRLAFLKNCTWCHANADVSLVPDLRRMTPQTHAVFDEIVLNGLYVPNGMPRFDDLITQDDTDAIHAYLIDLAQQAYDAQQVEE